MRWLVVAVGGLKQSACASLCDDYLTRLQRYTTTDVIEVRDVDRLAARVPRGARVVALTRTGDSWSSRTLADKLQRWKHEGRDVAFLIGDADGLPETVMADVHDQWSLSSLTFPHELARVVVLEQLYRAETILRGEPYHRGD